MKERCLPSTTKTLLPCLYRLSQLGSHGRKIAETIRDIAVDVRRIHRHVGASHPVRILHLIETSGPGGAELVLLDLARHLGSEYSSMIAILRPGWLRSQSISSGIPYTMLNGDGLGDLGVIAHLLRVVHQNHIRLIHAHEFYMNAIGATVSRLTGIPLVATVHGKNYYPEKRRRCSVYRMVAAQAAGVVAVSHDLQRFFCRTTGVHTNHVQVIYNGIDTRPSDAKRDPYLLESLGIPPKAPIIGTLGNLYPVKGHVYLIRAAWTILQQQSDIHVVILGRGGLKNVLSAEAEALGIQDRIHLVGYRDDARRWLSTMDVFTLPSLSEGLPLSLLEAMAAGIPVVVTDVGGMPEVIDDGQTGLIVPKGDVEALASKVLFLLQNPSVAVKMGAAGRSCARERFCLERMVAEYRGLYSKALASISPRKMA